MKKVIFLPFLLLLFFTFNNDTFAISGACSSHSGVSCTAGPDIDGSVVCNDGWSDSTVNYWEATECSKILCEPQKILRSALIKKAEDSGLLNLGTSSLCDSTGLNGLSTLNMCLDMRQQELNQVYSSIDSVVNENRYLCYANTTQSTSSGDSGGGGGGGSIYSNEKSIRDNIFTDVTANHQYAKEIRYLKDNNIVQGYSNGSYLPDTQINRAELLKIIVTTKFGNIDESYAKKCFKDIEPKEWYAKYVCFGKENNIVSGYKDNTFKPTQNITIAEAMKITLAAYGKSFSTDPWHKGYMDYFNDNIETLSNNWFCVAGCIPNLETISRGKMAYLIQRVATNQ